jgi:hypothetical protein
MHRGLPGRDCGAGVWEAEAAGRAGKGLAIVVEGVGGRLLCGRGVVPDVREGHCGLAGDVLFRWTCIRGQPGACLSGSINLQTEQDQSGSPNLPYPEVPREVPIYTTSATSDLT